MKELDIPVKIPGFQTYYCRDLGHDTQIEYITVGVTYLYVVRMEDHTGSYNTFRTVTIDRCRVTGLEADNKVLVAGYDTPGGESMDHCFLHWADASRYAENLFKEQAEKDAPVKEPF